jgi:tetratricopeptide (TPR) repeat protein
MFCYRCGRRLSEHAFCTACGADVSLYKKILATADRYYNDGLDKANVRDLSGAIASLRQCLKLNKNHIDARNLLGLVYFEMGEVVSALSEWVISKNLRSEKNIADDYIGRVQSNTARLDTINQTIKKYNLALSYCLQDSKDLAVIQLKKVLSMNPRFIRAHQLLALLYIEKEEWERAERELHKCIDIDRNNTLALRYLREVELMLAPDDSLKQISKRKKDEAVRYRSDNEIIIQPLSVKEPKSGGASTLINLGIGLLIGLAVTYFLLVPAAESNANQKAQQIIAQMGNESDTKSARIQELEKTLASLQREVESLNGQVQGIVGENGTLSSFDVLLAATNVYLQTKDVTATAAELEKISSVMNIDETSENFRTLYQLLHRAIGPQMAKNLSAEGSDFYRQADYAQAVLKFEKAVFYDETNEEALFQVGQTYRKLEDNEKAIEAYQKLLERFPQGARAKSARDALKQLGVS